MMNRACHSQVNPGSVGMIGKARSWKMFLLVPAALATLSCFDFKPPVTEQLLLNFLPGGEISLTVQVEIMSPLEYSKENNPALSRIRRAQEEYIEGMDPWSLRFNQIELAEERLFLEKKKGELVRVTHSGLLQTPEDLQDFFWDRSIGVYFVSESGEAELVFYPGGGSRASWQQRKILDKKMAEWLSDLATYLASIRELYAYLDDHPYRAEHCIGSLFEDLLSEERKEILMEPTDEEKALLEPLATSMEKLISILEKPEDSAFSVNELSQLVYDPFPAPMAVRVPGEILEVRGFHTAGECEVNYPGLNLWQSFNEIEGVWHAPDLLIPWLPYLLEERSWDEKFDLDAFLQLPRWATSPSPSLREIQNAIEASLSPAEEYLVRWSATVLEENEDKD